MKRAIHLPSCSVNLNEHPNIHSVDLANEDSFFAQKINASLSSIRHISLFSPKMLTVNVPLIKRIFQLFYVFFFAYIQTLRRWRQFESDRWILLSLKFARQMSTWNSSEPFEVDWEIPRMINSINFFRIFFPFISKSDSGLSLLHLKDATVKASGGG